MNLAKQALKDINEILAQINYEELQTKHDRNAYFGLKAQKAKLEKEDVNA